MKLSILYQDHHLVAINKSSGLLVHRSTIDRYETRFALQLLRRQLGRKVFPLHRLDKPTSGVLLFALNRDTAKCLSMDWQAVEKSYFALTRGKLLDTRVSHPIRSRAEKGRGKEKVQAAETQLRRLATAQLPVVFGNKRSAFTHTVFSWVQACPKTGRKHQIRKHLKHLNHPIVGDTAYGRGEINRYFRDNFAVQRLLLHCAMVRLRHPVDGRCCVIYAPLDSTWQRVLTQLPWRFNAC
ncbi:MAG: pseudouridylate synthase [Gammaproteobacteria bacterium]|nr:MAG: pseudouridylate synthase [Gammaproteobacteria bacterium]